MNADHIHSPRILRECKLGGDAFQVHALMKRACMNAFLQILSHAHPHAYAYANKAKLQNHRKMHRKARLG